MESHDVLLAGDQVTDKAVSLWQKKQRDSGDNLMILHLQEVTTQRQKPPPTSHYDPKPYSPQLLAINHLSV